MPRPTTKDDLMTSACATFDKMWALIDSMPDEALATAFDFSNDKSKKEDHWARDKNLRDVLVHLYEWHGLLMKWVKSNLSGGNQSLIPAPYTWKTYGDMNVEFFKKHQRTQLNDATKMLKKSHKQVLALIQGFSNQELFTKKYYSWTGTTSLGSYCISATSSHYDWAIKKLRAHVRNVSSK
ncbi:ClbS/DfsB family four-helix bundle protein [Simiduia litorea]|uniref:ClbS/DfsB family four-helix bundle protein n=1 Tax=Simiduia litorea TaxID=1435348 RepID=UPI0036F2BFBD